MRRIGIQIVTSIFLSLAILLAGCNKKPNRTVKGGAIGAGSGAVVGGVIGKVAGTGYKNERSIASGRPI